MKNNMDNLPRSVAFRTDGLKTGNRTLVDPNEGKEVSKGQSIKFQKSLKQLSLVKKQVRSGARKGVEQMENVLRGAKDLLFKKKSKRHKLLLAPMTDVTFEEYLLRVL